MLLPLASFGRCPNLAARVFFRLLENQKAATIAKIKAIPPIEAPMAADAPLESPPLDGAVDALAEGTDVCAEVAIEEMLVEVLD